MPRVKRHNLDKRTSKILADMHLANDDTLLTTPEVAAWFGVSEQWLEIGRSSGKWGPPFTKLSKRVVRYKVGDCRTYLTGRTFANTAEYERAEATA